MLSETRAPERLDGRTLSTCPLLFPFLDSKHQSRHRRPKHYAARGNEAIVRLRLAVGWLVRPRTAAALIFHALGFPISTPTFYRSDILCQPGLSCRFLQRLRGCPGGNCHRSHRGLEVQHGTGLLDLVPACLPFASLLTACVLFCRPTLTLSGLTPCDRRPMPPTNNTTDWGFLHRFDWTNVVSRICECCALRIPSPRFPFPCPSGEALAGAWRRWRPRPPAGHSTLRARHPQRGQGGRALQVSIMLPTASLRI